MIRIIFRSFITACFATFAVAIYFLGFTPNGLRADINLIAGLLPGKLHIDVVGGNLLSAFVLKNISYHDAQRDIEINSVFVYWHPRDLFKYQLNIAEINMNQANIVITKTSNSTEKLNLNFLKHIKIQQISFNNIYIKNQDAEINLDGTLKDSWDMSWKLNLPHIERFFAEGKGALTSTGKISGRFFSPLITGELQGKNILIKNQRAKQITVKANIIVQPKVNSTLKIMGNDVVIDNYNFHDFNLDLSGNIFHNPPSLITNLTAVFAKQYRFLIALTFPKFSGIFNFTQPINGTVETTLNNFQLISQFVPQIKNPHGVLQAKVFLQGTVAKPKITADFIVKNANASVPLLGISPSNINLQAHLNELFLLNFSGNFHSGNGTSSLQGNVDFKQANFPLTLALKGNDLLATDLPEYHVVISPDVKILFANQNLQLTGKIFIPEAKIVPKNFSNTETLPSEVVFVGGGNKTHIPLPFSTSLQIDVELGKSIYLAYKNLKTHLGGNLQILQTPDTLTNASGQLYAIKGTYKAYGRLLTIQNGRLIFAGGALMNPNLNITAVKQVKSVVMASGSNTFSNTNLQQVYEGNEEITVGVQVGGSIDSPVFTLYSNPTLSQGDIMSYLVFGYPQAQISGQQSGALLSALSAFNPDGNSFEKITNKIEKRLGFNELNIQSTQVFNPTTNSVVSATTFVVGKQLAPNLSMHYSVGLFYPLSILNLRYQLSKHFAVQSETSTLDNGADLLYVIERN